MKENKFTAVLIIKTYLIFESTVSAHQNEGALPGTRGGALPRE
jgi:hypothetical protein